ncbi:hypothetical protein [Paenibacillus macerans]|uniref:spike base protein, RCAP_Rcc01079 family n=1 Tax=Paenibacillus macerans TaxID=44252 RepID=UPI00203B0274|nr:hypothetical protein [Paenibacillus macerans]MCM3703795.1 hypothetical protein [Paenibacillus macerans]
MSTRVDESYQGGVVVTPSDTVNITFPIGTPYGRSVYVDVAGDVSAVLADGSGMIFTNLAAGVFHKIGVIRINSTGTTATGIKVMY